MYGATGKVGNKVYFRANGKTVARELVTPKNPKTDRQTIQRVVMAQVTKSYTKFKTICDHSFEGYTNGAQCANQFRKLNMRKARERAAEIQQGGGSLSEYYNFQPIGSDKWVPSTVILSQGQLRAIEVAIGELNMNNVASVAVNANTYASVCESLQLKRGDQLTLVCVNKFNGEYEVNYARIILDPRNADGSGASMDSAFIDAGAIVNPNWRNTGDIESLSFDGAINFRVGRGTLVAAAVIASRKDGNDWLRSNATLVISEEAIGSDKCSLWAAMEASYNASDLDIESEQYLNNAGVGGAQAPVYPEGEDDDTPSYSNNATINGIAQSVAGGSVSVNAPLQTVVVTGQNLADAPLYAVKASAPTEKIYPTKTATSATFNLSGVEGDTFNFYKSSDAPAWFSIQVQAASAPSGDEMTITSVNGTSKSKGGSATVQPSSTVTIAGTNMTGTWKLGTNDPTSSSATSVVFTAPAANGNYNVTFNGTNVFTLLVTNEEGD